jgi:diacylglycerol O-acyltransferase / wax synthase
VERLSALDAEFLFLEDGLVHMHVAGACVFDGPPPSFASLEALIAAKLHLLPRYRQRVRSVPLRLGRPVWVDDPHFDLGYHLRHTALPAPGDDAAFCRLMGRLMSQPLDRERPLWETWLVEGLEGGGWAIISKLHHCMVDGIAGVELLTVLLDEAPDTTIAEPRPWTPRPEPPAAVKVLDAWGGLAADTLGTLRVIPESFSHPVGAVASVFRTTEGAIRFLRRLAPTPPLSIEGPVGPHRVWAHSSASLDDVKAIRTAFGGTVNDVALAAVSGGYRALLLERGDDPDRAVVRSLVPVSTRRDADRGAQDNRVAALLYELPVGLPDPVERLEVVREKMTGLKSAHIVEAGEAVTSIGNLAPPMVVGPVTQLAIRAMHRFGQQSLNTVTTNVPGPQYPLFCLGRQMVEYLPFVPVSHGVRVGTGILSYNGNLYFGVTGDYETMKDVGVLAETTANEIEEMRDRALAPPGPRRAERPRKAG